MRIVYEHETSPIYFAATQSDLGRALLTHYELDPDDPSSFLFLSGGKALRSSSAVFSLAGQLRGWPKLLLISWIIPRPLTDFIYRVFAKNRYKMVWQKRYLHNPIAGNEGAHGGHSEGGSMTTGYSGTPLAKKLGIKDGMTLYVHGAPREYAEFFTSFPLGIKVQKRPRPETTNFIHIFATNFGELEKIVTRLKPALKKDGLMWISWPKGSSKIETDIKREPLRTLVLKTGLVDVKVCAVDENWSGLKFVYRLKDR